MKKQWIFFSISLVTLLLFSTITPALAQEGNSGVTGVPPWPGEIPHDGGMMTPGTRGGFPFAPYPSIPLGPWDGAYGGYFTPAGSGGGFAVFLHDAGEDFPLDILP